MTAIAKLNAVDLSFDRTKLVSTEGVQYQLPNNATLGDALRLAVDLYLRPGKQLDYETRLKVNRQVAFGEKYICNCANNLWGAEIISRHEMEFIQDTIMQMLEDVCLLTCGNYLTVVLAYLELDGVNVDDNDDVDFQQLRFQFADFVACYLDDYPLSSANS